MKIEGAPHTEITNNILSGFYYFGRNKGIKARLFEFSSPTFPIARFQAPYDAILPAPENSTGSITAVARRLKSIDDTITSNRSGKLYYYDRADLYGTCHGYGRTEKTFYSGFNFYQAFYPAGYFSPPYGETHSIFKSNQDGASNLYNGSCGDLTATEYNEQFGIVSMTAGDIGLTTNSLSAGLYSPIYSPRETCPPDVAVTNYFDEINLHQIQGTSAILGAGTFYSNNPIPTALDIYNIKVNGRYQISGQGTGKYILFESGRAKPSFSASNDENALNNSLCQAGILETDVAAGRGTNGMQLIQTVDAIQGNAGDQVFFNEGVDTAFYYWHFTFKENADSLPFFNNFKAINPNGLSHQGINQGTQLFLPVLSSDEAYWKNRQCPDTVDFLPWTLGASIYACPSEHFDVPYYAAIKKFGFYGTRFLNTCNAVDLSNTWSGVPMASEFPESNSPIQIAADETEPEGVDIGGSWNFAAYDNLLRTAKAEERYSNMYAVNKGFFFWANSGFIVNDPDYIRAVTEFDGVGQAFTGLIKQFQNVLTSGLFSFVSGEPKIVLQNGAANSNLPVESGVYNDLLFTNNAYRKFFNKVKDFIPATGMPLWYNLENRWGSFVSDGAGINEAFYSGIITGREKRVLTRYMENSIRGNPIDLFPLNHITFAFDNSKDYLESTGWARSLTKFKTNDLPQVNRRYFEGAYGNASEITGVAQTINALSFVDNTAFYPGFFNKYNGPKDLPTPSFVPVLSGIIVDNEGRRFSPSGWLALGYNEVGKLDGNFSCFTPLFTQQPLDKVFTKIGQAPTFRAQAVDYHSIPDDKMSFRYPEIIYWAYKLKLIDGKFRNLYPLKYKWMRVHKDQYWSFLASGQVQDADFASFTGSWGCLEGDGPECTMMHPTESVPTGYNGDASSYTFVKGAQLNEDDQYYYMCMASGRFGVRLSEPTQLVIEDWVKFDVSVKNGMNANAGLDISFGVYDKNDTYHEIAFEQQANVPYYGYQQDKYAVPEAVVEQKIPPPNAGYGDVTAYRFIGPVGYVGASRSYQPSTLKDTRGLREAWGRFIEYGTLVSFAKNLSQTEGDLLYGYKHLPTCSNYAMPAGQKGIKVIAKLGGYSLSHWTLPQKAVAASDTFAGIPWNKLTTFGGLYPPMTQATFAPDKNGKIALASAGNDPLLGGYGIGHWQWGNNLGAIKRFGKLSTIQSDDLEFIGRDAPRDAALTQKDIDKVKEKLLTGGDLAGINCGYTPLGLGRNMLYYLEAYERFYILCDPIKKKNVKNLSFICPGLRATNSAIQYCWLGKPNNTYLERRAMYGPYAYQWKVQRHNRDRNGNGMSEGFYSMGWSQRFSMMYDAPAVYGLYVKNDASTTYKGQVAEVSAARTALFPNGIDIPTLRRSWFGIRGDEGTSRPYGNMSCSCTSGNAGYNQIMCDYISAGQGLASSPDFRAYQCTAEQLANGKCFDPCISMRYGQGFFAGGKSQNLFGYTSSTSQNLSPKNVRLVSQANYDSNGNLITEDEKSAVDKNTYFRSPINTPHARIHRRLATVNGSSKTEQKVVGFSPCKDGGSDHCNFTTPTIHLKTSTILLTSASAFMTAENYAANLYESYNIRGDES